MGTSFVNIGRTISTVLLLWVVCEWTNSCFAQGTKPATQKIELNGNKFELELANWTDTISVADPITGIVNTKVFEAAPFPISMNGKRIYNANEPGVTVQNFAPTVPLEERILNSIRDAIPSIPVDDGILQLRLKHVIIDEHGKIVYTDWEGLYYIGKDNQTRTLYAPEPEVMFGNKTVPVATCDGKKVAYVQRIFLNNYLIELKDHVISYRRM